MDQTGERSTGSRLTRWPVNTYVHS